jgi:hypothetical protein
VEHHGSIDIIHRMGGSYCQLRRYSRYNGCLQRDEQVWKGQPLLFP